MNNKDWDKLENEFNRLFQEVSDLVDCYKDIEKLTKSYLIPTEEINPFLEKEKEEDKPDEIHRNSLEEFRNYQHLSIARVESLKSAFLEIRQFYLKISKDDKLSAIVMSRISEMGTKLNSLVKDWNSINEQATAYFSKKEETKGRKRSKGIGSSFESTLKEIKKRKSQEKEKDNMTTQRKYSCLVQ